MFVDCTVVGMRYHYFVFLYLIFLSQQVLYFLLSTLVLTLYIDVVLSLSIELIGGRWGRFRFFVNIRVCDGHQFPCFFIIYVIIQYQICSNHIYFISIGILIYENLGLDTQITFLLQLEQKLWHIHRNEVRNWRPSCNFFMFFVLFHIW